MKSGLMIVLFVISVTSIFILIVKNNKMILDKIEQNKSKKKFKLICNAFIVIFIIGFTYVFIKDIKRVNSNFEFAMTSIKNNKMFDIYDEKIEKENQYYRTCIEKEYANNYETPYILNGFHYVEGEWNTGYVIEDESGNQYVWIPVTNKDNIEAQKLIKKDFTINPIIAKEYCVDDNYEEFIKSSLENGGFYISRYEIGVENEELVSKAGKNILTELTKAETIEKISTMYPNQNDFHFELINGYAYDTTIEWLRKQNEVEVFDIDIEKPFLTGRNQEKNVYDIFDNILEYSIEDSYDTVVIRGFTKPGKIDEVLKENSRYAQLPEEKVFSQTTGLTARIVIYK